MDPESTFEGPEDSGAVLGTANTALEGGEICAQTLFFQQRKRKKHREQSVQVIIRLVAIDSFSLSE